MLDVLALHRLSFGPTPDGFVRIRGLPGATLRAQFEAWVERQLWPDAIDDRSTARRLSAAQLGTLQLDPGQLWSQYYAHNPYPDSDERYYDWRIRPFTETLTATWIRATYSERQLFEVLVDFWHNHFSVYALHDDVSPMWVHYDRDVIRANVFGNFRRMLESVTRSPAMLFYLNNNVNQADGPNENFARELLELHTLGSEHYFGAKDPSVVPRLSDGTAVGYVERDVKEVARCFTGWRLDDDSEDPGTHNTGAFLYYPDWHDSASKTVLARLVPPRQADMLDGRNVLDLLALHPSTASHVCRKLCQRLISDEPPASIVESSAQVFRAASAAPDQLRQVVRHIVLSNEFAASFGHKVKRPFEAAAGMLRVLGVDNITRLPGAFFDSTDRMGQPLFQHHAPNGYPDSQAEWANTMSLLNRWRFANQCFDGSLSDDGRLSVVAEATAQTSAAFRRADEIVDYWIDRVLGRPMEGSGRQVLISVLARGSRADAPLPGNVLQQRLPSMVALLLMSPDFQRR